MYNEISGCGRCYSPIVLLLLLLPENYTHGAAASEREWMERYTQKNEKKISRRCVFMCARAKEVFLSFSGGYAVFQLLLLLSRFLRSFVCLFSVLLLYVIFFYPACV